MHIAQITDCHLFADPARLGLGDVNPAKTLRAVLERVTQLSPDLLLCTGDITNDNSMASYQLFLRCLEDAGIDCDLRVIPGNHDRPDLMEEVFGKQLLMDAPFVSGNWMIHGLSSHFEGTLGKVEQSALDMLNENLQRNQSLHHLIAVHHHPIPLGGWMDRHEFVNRDELVSLVDTSPVVKTVICGHVHHAKSHTRDHCIYLTSPSTCWQFAASSDFSLEDSAPGFRQLHLLQDGTFDTNVIRV